MNFESIDRTETDNYKILFTDESGAKVSVEVGKIDLQGMEKWLRRMKELHMSKDELDG
jgi:hypothetical protein